jgi:hypothetical protein
MRAFPSTAYQYLQDSPYQQITSYPIVFSEHYATCTWSDTVPTPQVRISEQASVEISRALPTVPIFAF